MLTSTGYVRWRHRLCHNRIVMLMHTTTTTTSDHFQFLNVFIQPSRASSFWTRTYFFLTLQSNRSEWALFCFGIESNGFVLIIQTETGSESITLCLKSLNHSSNRSKALGIIQDESLTMIHFYKFCSSPTWKITWRAQRSTEWDSRRLVQPWIKNNSKIANVSHKIVELSFRAAYSVAQRSERNYWTRRNCSQ